MKATLVGSVSLRRCSLLSIFYALLCFGFGAHASVVPYLQSPSPNSVWVNWKTDQTKDSTVVFGTNESSLENTAEGSYQALSSDYFYHSVNLTGLSPDTRYFYQVISDDITSEVHSFRTPPVNGENSGHIRILVMGDHQIRGDNRYLQLVSAAKRKLEEKFGSPIENHINFILNVGDQVDVGTLDHYEHIHFAQSAPLSPYLPVMTTVGNHEYYEDAELANYRAHFIYHEQSYAGIAPAPDERYYAHQQGRVLFIHLDSMQPDEGQEAWLRGIVAAADSDPTVDWIISAIHHPYQAEQYVGDISNKLRDTWMGILSSSIKHAINFSGHHHLYARGQTRNWPTYHVISGGAAWNQYWGQSTEIDFDDVQKTITNWNWQLVDIDINARTMTVESYAEAHPLRFEDDGFDLDSKLIDTFYRKLDGGKPHTPALQNSITEAVSLPYTFVSSQFSTDQQDALNSTQFQFAKDADFNTLIIDRIRDIENIYGDTGKPFYEPIDTNADVDILSWEVPELGLPNGQYFVRVRHRDANLEWSDWSEALMFEITGSTDGQANLTLEKTLFEEGEPVSITYSGGIRTDKDWIGIYNVGQTPGDVTATQWQYASALTGEMQFDGLEQGEYFAAFFKNNGYEEQAERVRFHVGLQVTLSSEKANYTEDESIVISWQGSSVGDKDWLGIYSVGQSPGDVTAVRWQYAGENAGTATFDGLPEGNYFATFMVNDGYDEIAPRVLFTVGEPVITLQADTTIIQTSQSITFEWSGMPGNDKDWLGVYRIDHEPQVNLATQWDYLPSAQGSIDYSDFTPGQYYAALFLDDGYTQASERFEFEVITETVQGDVNGDGVLTLSDAAALRTKFGQCQGDEHYTPIADLNNDTCINFLDHGAWLTLYRAQ